MKGINPALQDMIARNQLSERKIELLIILKKFIDRLAGRNHLSEEELLKLESQYGVRPDVVTWGDYFQTRVASDHWEKTEDEFEKIMETIHFDIIASVLIFTGKDGKFTQSIEERCNEIELDPNETISPEDEEQLHLGILLNYYREMQLDIASLEKADFNFFEQYSSERAIS